MADYNAATVPPPPTNAPKTVNAPKGSGAGGPTTSRTSAADKLDKTLKFMNFGLLAWILFGWLSWVIFLAGVSAVTKTADDLADSDTVQNLYGFAWLCLWAWFFILLALTVATVASLTSKTRHVVSITSRGMLFFLAILISWLGREADRAARDNRGATGDIGSRVSTLLAGEIMTLIAACLIAITLLLMDQARTHSGSDAANRNESLTDAAAATVGGNQSAGGGPVGTYGGSHGGSAV